MMTEAEKFAYCLALTESANDIRAWGDDHNEFFEPLAAGRFQIHPARHYDLVKRYKLVPRVLESWNSYWTRLVIAMYEDRSRPNLVGRLLGRVGYSPLAIAQYWHLGHFSSDSEYDKDYGDRFLIYWNRH